MHSLRSDPALYYMFNGPVLVGLSGTYVDDMLRVGTPEFRTHTSATNKKFDMGADDESPCNLTDF